MFNLNEISDRADDSRLIAHLISWFVFLVSFVSIIAAWTDYTYNDPESSALGTFFIFLILGFIVYVVVGLHGTTTRYSKVAESAEALRLEKEKAANELAEIRKSPIAVMTLEENGTQSWWQSGKRHRVDGPAVIKVDGTEEWWRHGQLHRVGGPAVVRPDGITMWCTNGKVDRRDGPAIEFPDGTVQYWINDEELSKEEFDALKLPLDNG